MPATSQTRRLLEVAAVLALWIAQGIVLHLSVTVYLLLGIPLIAAFQWGVRRQPLRALWVRDAKPFRLDATGWMMAVLLTAYPSYCLARNLRSGGSPAASLWLLAAAAGAFAAAYALRNFHRAMVRDVVFCLATAGGVGIIGISGSPAAQANGVRFVRQDGRRSVFEIGAGTYDFEVIGFER